MNSLVLRSGYVGQVHRVVPRIDNFPITEIRSTVGKLAEALEVLAGNGEKGGVLRIHQIVMGRGKKILKEGATAAFSDSAEQIFFDVFGGFDPKQRLTFEEFSQEKTIRLWAHPRHHSSYESRNERKKLYGGAIRTSNHFIISCSGMSEQEDEALSLYLALHLRWLSKQEASRIAERNGNDIFTRLSKAVDK